MYNDPTMGDQQINVAATGPQGEQFIQGAPVYDSNGDKVGTVSEHGVQHGCLVIHHGLLRDDVYVPLDRIRGSDANGVTLNMTQDEVKALPVNQPPMTEWADTGTSQGAYTGTAAGTGAAYTDTAADTGRMQQGQQTGERAIPLREEELVARKQPEEQGRVRVHKDVTEEQKTVTAPVTHEEVRVERQPVDRPADVPPGDWQDKDINVPVEGERLTAEKRPRVAEEVHIEKQPVTEQEQVSGTVRREQVRLDNQGDVPIERAGDQDQGRMGTQP